MTRKSTYLPIGLALISSLFSTALGATFTVTNANDTGAGSLREALEDANTNAGADTIDFALGGGLQTITLTSGTLIIRDTVTIQGPIAAANRVTISGGNAFKVFDVTFGTGDSAAIRDLSITEGGNLANTRGGGIDHIGLGSLELTHVEITQCLADSGAAVYFSSSAGSLTIQSCTFAQNEAGISGGGMFIAQAGGLKIQDSTISGNSATTGGGCFISVGVDGAIVNSTISGNQATNSAAGVYVSVSSCIKITACTITNNLSDSDGDGICGGGGVLVANNGKCMLGNSIVAANFHTVNNVGPNATHPDVYAHGSIVSIGGNVIGDGADASQFISSDLVGDSTQRIAPKLGPLQNNGGRTETHLLLGGSPAIDFGDQSLFTAPCFTPPLQDQRGEPRVQDSDADTGAIEFQAHLAIGASDVRQFLRLEVEIPGQPQ